MMNACRISHHVSSLLVYCHVVGHHPNKLALKTVLHPEVPITVKCTNVMLWSAKLYSTAPKYVTGSTAKLWPAQPRTATKNVLEPAVGRWCAAKMPPTALKQYTIQRMPKSWNAVQNPVIRITHWVVKLFSSELTCFSAVESCTQSGKSGKFNLKCLSGVKTCTQRARTFSNTNMQCDGDSCDQSCSTYSTCNMSCSASVKECTQFEEWNGASVVTMNCDADVCTQKCNGGHCNMTCTSNVKECTQLCKQGTCSTRCNAQICLRDFGISTTAGSTSYLTNPTVSSKSSVNFLTFCLVLISLVISTSTYKY